MRTFRFAAPMIALALLTACSSGDKPSTATSSSPAPKPATPKTTAKDAASLDPCQLLPADTVSKTLNVPGLAAAPGPVRDNEANGGKARTCEYSLNGKVGGALAVTRYEGRRLKPSEMVAALKNAKPGAQDVPGFPDGAVYYIEDQKTATLAAAKVVAGTPVLINYTGTAKMTQAMMTPLVQAALAAS